jgi:hypothetical protein
LFLHSALSLILKELYRTTKGGVVFDLPVSQEADVKAAFDAEQQEVALVTGDLPEVLNFPTNLVPSRKRFGQQRDGFLNACNFFFGFLLAFLP